MQNNSSFYRWVTGVLSLILVLGSTSLAQADGKRINLHREIKEFFDSWNAAISSADSAKVRSSYISDDRFNWFEDGKLTYTSRDQIIEKLKSFPAGTKVETKLDNVRVDQMSDTIAFGSASFATRIAMPTGDFTFSGVFTAILEKEGGKWRFLSGHTSSLPSPRNGSSR